MVCRIRSHEKAIYIRSDEFEQMGEFRRTLDKQEVIAMLAVAHEELFAWLCSKVLGQTGTNSHKRQ